MKIVLAVDLDKQTIVKRTGQAPFFVIYEDGKILKYVDNSHKHSHSHNHAEMHHHEHTNEHKKDVELLNGCDIFLVQAVGENMKEAIESVGMQVKKIRQKHGQTADEVVDNFLKGNI